MAKGKFKKNNYKEDSIMNQNENVVTTGNEEKKSVMEKGKGFFAGLSKKADDKIIAKAKKDYDEAVATPKKHWLKKTGKSLLTHTAVAATTLAVEHRDEIHVTVGNTNKGGNSRRMAAMQQEQLLRANQR